jgi:hypothetical protein
LTGVSIPRVAFLKAESLQVVYFFTLDDGVQRSKNSCTTTLSTY